MEKTLKPGYDGNKVHETQNILEVRIKGNVFKNLLQYFGPPELLSCEWIGQRELNYLGHSLYRIFLIRQSGDPVEIQVPIWKSAGAELRGWKDVEAMAEMEKAVRILDKFTIEGAGEFILRSITYSPGDAVFDKNGMPSDNSHLTFTYRRRAARPRPGKNKSS